MTAEEQAMDGFDDQLAVPVDEGLGHSAHLLDPGDGRALAGGGRLEQGA